MGGRKGEGGRRGIGREGGERSREGGEEGGLGLDTRYIVVCCIMRNF